VTTSDQEHWQCTRGPNAGEHVEVVDCRKIDVEHDEVGRGRADDSCERARAVRTLGDREASPFERQPHGRAHAGVVVDDQDVVPWGVLVGAGAFGYEVCGHRVVGWVRTTCSLPSARRSCTLSRSDPAPAGEVEPVTKTQARLAAR